MDARLYFTLKYTYIGVRKYFNTIYHVMVLTFVTHSNTRRKNTTQEVFLFRPQVF